MDDNLAWYRGRGRSMRMVRFSALAIAITLAAFGTSAGPEPWSAKGMDRPLKKQVVDSGPSPYYPGGRVRIKLTCYFYAKVMVKQYDAGQKGAEWLAIVPVKEGMPPKCSETHAPEERVIDGGEWGGYFKGVKGRFVFFDASDGMDLGIPFAVYDSITGKKILEDSAYDSRIENRKVEQSLFNRMRVSTAADGTVILKYLRVADTGCDLHTKKETCWEEVRKKFDLKNRQPRVCVRYENLPTPWESAIAYPVESSLPERPETKTIAGPIRCWPVD
jgi:hypothetical protein